MKGKVYLVGAGPGDPDLLSLKAVEILKKADVVLYDRLVSDDVLRLIPRRTRRIFIGKEGGRHTLPQEEINDLLVKEARRGGVVVRLKGGDPFLFGRGGEEAQWLKGLNIPFEVVPGVSSAIAVPAYAGIPITHRKYASSVAVVTGHEDPTKRETMVRWRKLATAADTIVILMGVGRIGVIMKCLMEGGRSADTPVAVIERGTMKDQRTVIGNVGNIAEKVKTEEVKPPAIIVVGDVAKLHSELNWFEQTNPLRGKVIAVTRPQGATHKLAKLISERSGVPLIAPTVEVRPLPYAGLVKKLIQEVISGGIDYVIFMSINGVRAAFEVAREGGVGDEFIKALGRVRVLAIGPKTRGEIERHGVRVSLVPQRFSSRGIVECLSQSDLRGKTIALVRASGASPFLSGELRKRGTRVLEVGAYKTDLPSDRKRVESLIEDLVEGKVDAITFTSPSAVQNIFAVAGDRHRSNDLREKLGDAVVAAIGPTTQEALKKAGVHTDVVPARYTIESMVEALSRHFRAVER